MATQFNRHGQPCWLPKQGPFKDAWEEYAAHVAANVAALRVKAGLSQAELAELSGLPVAVITQIEEGTRTFTNFAIEKIAAVFPGVNAKWISPDWADEEPTTFLQLIHERDYHAGQAQKRNEQLRAAYAKLLPVELEVVFNGRTFRVASPPYSTSNGILVDLFDAYSGKRPVYVAPEMLDVVKAVINDSLSVADAVVQELRSALKDVKKGEASDAV